MQDVKGARMTTGTKNELEESKKKKMFTTLLTLENKEWLREEKKRSGISETNLLNFMIDHYRMNYESFGMRAVRK